MTEQKSSELPDHWLFVGISPAELGPLLDRCRVANFFPGDALFREGEPTDGLYLITGGSARVSTITENGETLLAAVGANDVLGEMGVLDGKPRSATAMAVSVVTACFIPADAFLDALERSPAVALRMLTLLAQRLRQANGRLGELPVATVIRAGDGLD
jgi:CRP-like cAMP-binding protein